jgi:hypothetical protein
MARLFADQLSVAAGALQTDASLLPAVASRSRLLGAIAVGGFLGVLITLSLAGPVAMEPGLIRLLHGMVAIKGLIFTAAAALVLRRLRGPVNARVLLGYAAGLGLSAGALAWLWGLSGLLVGSIAFYGGLIVTLKTASRDRLLVAGFTQGRT